MNASELGKDLNDKLGQLSSLYEHPRLFITEYFYEIRNQIDYEVEKALLSLENEGEKSELNKQRMELIKELDQQQQRLLDRLPALSSEQNDEVWRAESESLATRIKAFRDDADISDLKDLYEELVMRIRDEINARENELLSGQSFMFFESFGPEKKSFGLLVHFSDDFLNRDEVKVFKKEVCGPIMLSFIKRRELAELNKLIETSMNESFNIFIRKPFVLSRSMLLIMCLGNTLNKMIQTEAKTMIRIDKELFSESKTTLPNRRYMELRNDCAAIMGKLVGISIEGIDTRPNPFEYFKAFFKNLDLHRNKMTNFNVDLSNLDIYHLNLNNNCIHHFDQESLKKLTKITELDLTRAFKLETRFNWNMLASFKNLIKLSLTITDETFSFKIFEDLDKIREIILETATCMDANVKRLKLRPSDIDTIFEGSFAKMWTLSLSGFDTCGSVEELFKREGPRRISLQNNLITEITHQSFLKCTRYLEHLNLSFNPIAQLEDGIFSSLINLKDLDLKKCVISKLSKDCFEGLESLSLLYLEGNRIEALPDGIFDGLGTLSTLNLDKNRLVKIQAGLFDKLKSLIVLRLSFNPLETIEANSFIHLQYLRGLSIIGCKIKTIDNKMFQGLTGLYKLSLANNEIESIVLKMDDSEESVKLDKANLSEQEIQLVKTHLFQELNQVEEIDLSQNRLAKLDLNIFYNLENLKRLILSGNHIEELNSEAQPLTLKFLLKLNLSHNRLKSLNKRAFLSSSDSLRDLDLSSNQIEHLEDDFFLPFSSLSSLDLHDNRLTTTISDETFPAQTRISTINLTQNKNAKLDENKLKNMTMIKKLSLDTINDFKTVLSFKALEHLCVKKSNPAFFDALLTNKKQNKTILDRLESISLSSISTGALANITFSEYFPQIKELDFSNSIIETLENPALFGNLLCVEKISLRSNKLKSLHHELFNGLFSLKALDLSQNDLAALPNDLIRELIKLQEINLSGNKFEKLNVNKIFKKTTHLAKINLSNNLLQNDSFTDDSFSELYELTELSISNNRLRDLAFVRDLAKLEFLNLSNNQIKSIYDQDNLNLLGRLMSLRHLDLSGNKIHAIRSGAFKHFSSRFIHLDLTRNDLTLDQLKALD